MNNRSLMRTGRNLQESLVFQHSLWYPVIISNTMFTDQNRAVPQLKKRATLSFNDPADWFNPDILIPLEMD